MWCGVPELDRGLRDRSDPAPFLRGASTTTYASSKLNRVGRKAARYDSGLSAHKCNRPAHKRPTPHRIAVDCCAVPQVHVEQIACSRSRCGNFTPFTALFPLLPPVNPCQHPVSLPFAPPPPSRQHNHARYDAFGNLLHSTGTTPNNYLFAGEQFDPDLHLYYNRARYLNTSTGRFWSMDSYEGDQQSPASL